MKATLHQILHALVDVASGILLTVDAGELGYDAEVEMTLEGNQLKIQKGEGANKYVVHQETI